MAPLSFSPETSISSHTLSIGSGHAPTMEPPSSSNSTTALLSRPHMLLQPTTQTNLTFLEAAKYYLDPVATGVSELQAQRQQDLRRKRKRGEGYHDGDMRVLHLRKLHLQGFGVDQVFEQTKKILDAAADEIELALPDEDNEPLAIDRVEEQRPSEEVSEEDEIMSDDDMSDAEDFEDKDLELDGADISEDDIVDGEEEAEELELGGEDIEADEDVGVLSGDDFDDEAAEEYQADPNGLNDGFFEIERFNKVTDFLEQQDNRGDAGDSDEEEIDWEGDPFAPGAGGNAQADDLSPAADSGSDDEGPTFGDVDLNAPEGDSENEELEEGDLDGMEGSNANNIMYADFFAPPAQKAGKRSKKKRGRPNPHNFPSASDPQDSKPAAGDANEDDVQATISRVQRDLFEDSDDPDDAPDDALSDRDPSDPISRRSTHERRQAKIAQQIRALEAANVAKRSWQLSGEARAADRPVNSLLEEGDLDYERAGKPIPVITAEVSEDIEALIKRRILAGEFDEVLRRRPDDLATGPQVRRGRFELDDTKATKSLAELYEEEHLKLTDANFVDAKDEKLKKEHAEISALWTSVCAKLDSLSSSHFKPKPAAANLEIRVDAPAISMEDARPTAGADAASASILAPQEVYKPGEQDAGLTRGGRDQRPKKNTAEIVPKSGLPVARDEMSREDKARRRRREKERSRKHALHAPLPPASTSTPTPASAGVNGNSAATTSSNGARNPNSTAPASRARGSLAASTQDKKQLLGDLRKGGVQVIGRKGVVTDMEGRQVKDGGARKGGAGYKL